MMKNKTPVSMLQEMMVKKQTIPNYELVHNGGGTHINTFVYQVTCDGLSATGTGRCKKDAKHEAAKAMLEAIAAHNAYPQLPPSPAQSPARTPVPPTVPVPQRLPPSVPFLNAIGALQDLCFENNLEEPNYILISDVGPPHARIFTIQCVVATFKEEGIATTKKQAKHEAAKKMLDRINDLVADLKDMDLNSSMQCEESRKKEKIANEIAKARYPLLTKLPNIKKVNLGLKLSKYHLQLKESMEEEIRTELINRLESLVHFDLNNVSDELVDQKLEEFKTILSTVNLEVTDRILESAQEKCFLVAMRVDSCPAMVQMASGGTEREARLSVMSQIIKSLLLLLQ